MNRIFLNSLALSFLLIASGNVLAGQYIGFDVCNPTTPEKIKTIMEEAGATNVAIEEDNDSLTTTIRGENYPVAAGSYPVEVHMTRGKVYDVSVKDADSPLSDALHDKYGEPFKSNKEILADTWQATNFYYRNPKNDQVKIKFSIWIGLRELVKPEAYLTYECTSLEKARIAEIERNRAAERKKASKGKSL